MQENQEPGQIIIPHGPSETPSTATPSPLPSSTLPTPQPVVVQPPAQPVVSAETASPEAERPIAQATVADQVVTPGAQPVQNSNTEVPTQEGGWGFHQEEDVTVAQHTNPLPDNVSWTAAEFVAHEKGFGWYAALALGGAMAAAIIYLLTKDKITTGIIIFALIAFGVFASRKPRTTQYTLSAQGMQVGAKIYAFHDFKTFSIVDEGQTASIVFMPLKRFMPPLTMYVTSEVEDKVVDFLSAYLPFSEHKGDAVDNLMRRIRF